MYQLQCTLYIVIPPNSNTLSDWRRTCHMPWIKFHCTLYIAINTPQLKYTPTQIPLKSNIRRRTWHVTCHTSPISLTPKGDQNSLNSLRKQQLELSTRTWSGCVPWNGGKFVCQSALCHKAIEVRQHFSLHYLPCTCISFIF